MVSAFNPAMTTGTALTAMAMNPSVSFFMPPSAITAARLAKVSKEAASVLIEAEENKPLHPNACNP